MTKMLSQVEVVKNLYPEAASYPHDTYRVKYYNGENGILEHFFISANDFRRINTITIEFTETGLYRYFISLGPNHYAKKPVGYVMFCADKVLSRYELDQQVEGQVIKAIRKHINKVTQM